MVSDIVTDALESSLSCIDRIPIMDNITENYQKIKQMKDDMENNGLLSNIQSLIETKDQNINPNWLTEDLIFKDLLDVQRNELKERILVDPNENKKAIAIEKLIDQANRQTSDVIYLLDKDKHALSFEKLKESIADNIKVHQRRLDEIRNFNKELEARLFSH